MCIIILICDLEGKASELHVLSKNIQHSDHLGEDQDTMAGLSQANQQLVQQEQLTTASYQRLGRRGGEERQGGEQGGEAGRRGREERQGGEEGGEQGGEEGGEQGGGEEERREERQGGER